MSDYYDLIRSQDLSDVKAGDEIYEEVGSHRNRRWIKTKVERVTKTMIVLSFSRYNKKTSYRVGDGSYCAILKITPESTSFVQKQQKAKEKADAEQKKRQEERDARRQREQAIIDAKMETILDGSLSNDELHIEEFCSDIRVSFYYEFEERIYSQSIVTFNNKKLLTQWLDMRTMLKNK